jgi:hypothetical protein
MVDFHPTEFDADLMLALQPLPNFSLSTPSCSHISPHTLLLTSYCSGDPAGLEPELAAGLRRVAREGLGAPLEDLEVQPPEGEEEEREEEGEGR